MRSVIVSAVWASVTTGSLALQVYTARLKLAAARKTHAAAWRRLAMVVGTPDMQPSPLADSLDETLPNLAYIDRLRELWLSAVEVDGLLLTGGLEAPGNN